ncbi:myb-related transcription factor, partner of profilin-like [Ambystoma mexicanum]|uniref:myb-related transcription factor, partner of profilin-like n=1 Tax=Ambystoma mexicanum TaxID=8296 RepID=UPI0037E8E954
MPKSLKKSTDHLHKERFSQEELNMLAETLQEHAEVVFSTNISRPALLRKKAIWAEVAQKVSAVGTTPCTPKDVRKRWDDLRLPPTPATKTQEPVAEGTVSGVSSIVGETAATAAVSDDEAESLTQGTTVATAPLHSPQLSPTSIDNINRQEMSPWESWAASFSPPQSLPEEPTMPVAHHSSTSVPISQEGMRAIQQRQDELAGLLTQYITECGHARDEMRECASSIRSAIETSSKEICSELAAMRQVLSQMVAAMQAMAPAQVAEQPATSSNASSTRTSPMRRSRWNLRRSVKGPPDAGRGEGVWALAGILNSC